MKNVYIQFFTVNEPEYRYDFFRHKDEQYYIEASPIGKEPKNVSLTDLCSDIHVLKKLLQTHIHRFSDTDIKHSDWIRFIFVFIHPTICGIQNFLYGDRQEQAKEPDNEELNLLKEDTIDGVNVSFFYSTSSPFRKLKEWKYNQNETWDNFLRSDVVYQSLSSFLDFILHRYFSFNGIYSKTANLLQFYKKENVKERFKLLKKYSEGFTFLTFLMSVRNIVDAEQKNRLSDNTADNFLPKKLPAVKKNILHKAWTEMQQTIQAKKTQCSCNDLAEFIESEIAAEKIKPEKTGKINGLLREIKEKSGFFGEQLFRLCLLIDIFFLVCYNQ